MKHHVIGIDFGTLSARALILDAHSGKEVATAEMNYPNGVLDHTLPCGSPLKDKSALQDPRDYLAALSFVIPEAMKRAGLSAEEIAGLGIDFTACTLLPIKADGSTLRDDPAFSSNPHAWVKLWKHHASQPQADRINALVRSRGERLFALSGRKVCAENLLPKVLEILEDAPDVFEATDRFIEAGDWLSLLLTGRETHAPTFAGLKSGYDPDLGFPSPDFLSAIDERLRGLYGTKASDKIEQTDNIAGYLGQNGAKLTGLLPGTPLALPAIDAEAAMPALGITGEDEAMLILGTSGVLIVNDKKRREIDGMCGGLRDGILEGYYTYEAALASLGDTYDWFVRRCVPPDYIDDADRQGVSIHRHLRDRIKDKPIGQSGLLALDWLGGNRSVLSDGDLSGMILGLTLSTRPEEIYRALIESTAFGIRRAMEAFTEDGVTVGRIIAAGGIARKDEMLMQIYADVLNREIRVPETTQAGARGSAICAAHAAGLYRSRKAATIALASPLLSTYSPIPENVTAYETLYREYKRLHDYFGCGENPIMKTLAAMRRQANR